MGQQQLLIIVVGLIIVGIAITGGIYLFKENSVEQKRNNLINDCVNLASLAQMHYRKPGALGGGNNTFDGSRGGSSWVIPTRLDTTGNGWYTINSIDSKQIVIEATGNEIVTGNLPVKVEITITPSDYNVTVIN